MMMMMMMILSSKNFVTSKPEKFKTNLSVHLWTPDWRIIHTYQQFVFPPQKNGVTYSAIKVFSTLPPHITKMLNKKQPLKHALKEYLIVHAFYSLEVFLL